MDIISFSINLLIRINRKTLNFLVRIQHTLNGRKYDSSGQHKKVIQSTKDYDMVSSPDEPYYAEQYLHWIKKYISEYRLPADGKYLDLGCSQGRMSLPLAEFLKQSNIIGVDISKDAILQAKKYATGKNIKNIEYVEQEIVEFLKSQKDNSSDGALFLEVAFFMPEYEEVIKELKRVLKPNGLLFASLRPRYFDVLLAVKYNYLNNIEMILKGNKGKLFNSDIMFCWQSSEEMKKMMDEIGFRVLGLYAIGCCSGIEGDPHSLIARPSLLDKDAKKVLMNLEINLAESLPDAGRYVLCIVQK